TLSIAGGGPRSGVRASIRSRWPISILIATHLQLHLAITKIIPAGSVESTPEVLYAQSMIKIPVETPTATLRYALAPDEAGIAAIEATFTAYDGMMAILAEVA